MVSCLKDYLASIGTSDEKFYLYELKHYLYKDYQYYYLYYDLDSQSAEEAVESVLENQLKGRVSLDDIDWSVWPHEEDCICIWDLTLKAKTQPSWLRETVELTNSRFNRGVNYDRKF